MISKLSDRVPPNLHTWNQQKEFTLLNKFKSIMEMDSLHQKVSESSEINFQAFSHEQAQLLVKPISFNNQEHYANYYELSNLLFATVQLYAKLQNYLTDCMKDLPQSLIYAHFTQLQLQLLLQQQVLSNQREQSEEDYTIYCALHVLSAIYGLIMMLRSLEPSIYPYGIGLIKNFLNNLDE